MGHASVGADLSFHLQSLLSVTTGRVAQHSGHTQKGSICSLLCSGVYRRRTFDTQGALYSVSSTLVHASVGADLSLFNTGRVAQHSGHTKRVHLQFALSCCPSAQNFDTQNHRHPHRSTPGRVAQHSGHTKQSTIGASGCADKQVYGPVLPTCIPGILICLPSIVVCQLSALWISETSVRTSLTSSRIGTSKDVSFDASFRRSGFSTAV